MASMLSTRLRRESIKLQHSMKHQGGRVHLFENAAVLQENRKKGKLAQDSLPLILGEAFDRLVK